MSHVLHSLTCTGKSKGHLSNSSVADALQLTSINLLGLPVTGKYLTGNIYLQPADKYQLTRFTCNWQVLNQQYLFTASLQVFT